MNLRSNPVLEPTSNKQYWQSILRKNTGAFDGAPTHDCIVVDEMWWSGLSLRGDDKLYVSSVLSNDSSRVHRTKVTCKNTEQADSV